MTTSEQIDQIAAALAKAQRAMKPAVKDSTNPHFKSHYADLASCWDACREALTANSLSVIQGASADGERVTVTTLLLHSSGQWVQDALTSSARDAGAQSVGSAITYGRRYGLCAMVGIAPEDDDGNAAQSRGPVVAARPVSAPDGYGGWLADMQSVADEGVDRLREEWKTQPAAFREHLTKHDTVAYEALRERAKRVPVPA